MGGEDGCDGGLEAIIRTNCQFIWSGYFNRVWEFQKLWLTSNHVSCVAGRLQPCLNKLMHLIIIIIIIIIIVFISTQDKKYISYVTIFE